MKTKITGTDVETLLSHLNPNFPVPLGIYA
jgi:hypothetical protein